MITESLLSTSALLAAIKARVAGVCKNRFKGLVLYGSEARHEATVESDLDILVLLNGPLNIWDDLKIITTAIYDLQLDFSRSIHITPVDEKVYMAGEYAFYRNAQKEGVLL